LALWPFIRRPRDEIAAAFLDPVFLFALPLVVKVVELRFRAFFSTIAKIRFILDFETPRWEANVVADFTGNEMVMVLDTAT